jgi:hypothetical protein
MADEPDLDQWLRAVCAELQVPAAAVADTQVLLDVARDVAHGVLRPAAPLTTYVVGVAVGMALVSGADVSSALRQAANDASRLAGAKPSWAERQD